MAEWNLLMNTGVSLNIEWTLQALCQYRGSNHSELDSTIKDSQSVQWAQLSYGMLSMEWKLSCGG